jgi:SAM-dependent methyltransferase
VGEDYAEMKLCHLCLMLCEKCEDKHKISSSNLCESCHNRSKYDTSVTKEIDITDMTQTYDYSVCKLIDKLCNKHPVDSVDAPINGTIGNKCIEVIIEGLCDLIDEKKPILLDLGSGNGKTATKFAAVLDTIAVGIEYDQLRFECSMVNLQAISKDIDINVNFIHGDIELYFNSFNGYDLIYMFDTAFIPTTIQKIKELFNKSTSVKAIICNSRLDDLGFHVSLYKSLGPLIAGNTVRNFYIFKSNICDTDNTLDNINNLDIQNASNKDIRMDIINNVSDDFLNKSRVEKFVDQKHYKELYKLLKKSPAIINGEEFIKCNQAVGTTAKASSYTVFNRQDLAVMNKFEYKAIAWNSKYLAVITPSYDGIGGEILISIIHYTVGPTYEAVIYNIRSDTFRKVSVRSLLETNFNFNSNFNIPINVGLEDIMTKYREDYPIEDLSVPKDLQLSTSVTSVNIDCSRKRKPNELYNKELLQKRSYTKSSTAQPKKTIIPNATESRHTMALQLKISQLEEDSKMLKRKLIETENSSSKRLKESNYEEVNHQMTHELTSKIKSHEYEIKDLRRQHELHLRELKLAQESAYQLYKNQKEVEIKESLKIELDNERNSRRVLNEQLERLRSIRELDQKEYHVSQETLMNRMIDMQEDKYHDIKCIMSDIRSDGQVYADKIIDLAKALVVVQKHIN